MSRVSVKPGTGPEHPTTPPEYIWNTPRTPSAPPPKQHLTGWIPGTFLMTKIRPKKLQNQKTNKKSSMNQKIF